MSQPTLWGFDENERGGQVRSTDPETSHRVAASVQVGSYHAMVVLLLAETHPKGMTARAVSDGSYRRVEGGAGPGQRLSPEKASTRLKELHDRGFVEFVRDPSTHAPLEAPTTPGNTGRLHVLNQRGYELSVILKTGGNRLSKES